VKVAAIQHDIVWEDPSENFERLGPRIADAAAAGAHLVVLAEMYSTGFSMETARVAEPVDGPSARFLVDRAIEHGIWTCGSVPEVHPGDERPANTFVLAAPDGEVLRYRKIHPFTYGGEHEQYAAGDQLVTVDIDGVRCSLFVCYDLRFADEFWGLAAATDCYVVVANWPSARREHWRTLVRARAIENQAYVVAVNRVGRGGKLDYAGDSAVIGPFGEELAVAEEAVETTLFADVDPAHVASTRARFPFITDRR
jgi:predicted amidohydrolase